MSPVRKCLLCDHRMAEHDLVDVDTGSYYAPEIGVANVCRHAGCDCDGMPQFELEDA